MEGQRRIHIGTSGWHYAHWKGPFYPPGIKSEEMLVFYASHFQDAEINASFYHLPKAETLENWYEIVPEGFLFSAKASRYITHMKKLKDPEEPVRTFLESIGRLGKRVGPILFQLPPNWKCNVDRLRHFLEILPPQFRYCFEFRDPTWFDEGIYTLLRQADAAFCIYELAGTFSPCEVTSDFVYIRLHGPAAAYEGSYNDEALAGWAKALTRWAEEGKEVFCFFDNDQNGYAAQNALTLKRMLEG